MIEIVRAGRSELKSVIDLVSRLLAELGDPPVRDRDRVLADLVAAGDRFVAFVAREAGEPAGVMTLTEHVAIYAGGRYGVIDELYVVPARRSAGVGGKLLAAAVAFGREKGWRRIDVTAPPGAAWGRSVRFYEGRGFVFTGPKLRLDLPGV